MLDTLSLRSHSQPPPDSPQSPCPSPDDFSASTLLEIALRRLKWEKAITSHAV